MTCYAVGVVTFRPRRGQMVISFGPEEITEIFDMRMVLEEHAGYVATPKRTDAEVARVGEMLWKIGVLKRAELVQMRAWSAYNREFHARLFAASGRPGISAVKFNRKRSPRAWQGRSLTSVSIQSQYWIRYYERNFVICRLWSGLPVTSLEMQKRSWR